MQVHLNFKPEMSVKEIVDLFDWYDFKDEHGHRLTNCVDFQALVDCAVIKYRGIAQVAECRVHTPDVGGSTPPPATTE